MSIPMIDGGYRVILADPPWAYRQMRSPLNGAASAHYDCMSLADIAALPVKAAAAVNAALLLWTTSPVMAEGGHLPIMEAWGFRPVTIAFVWRKWSARGNPYTGLGFYTRSGAEYVVLGIRGQAPRRKEATKVMQVIDAPVGRHSEKPESVQDAIEHLWGGPYLELFARRQRPGWVCWGNEL